VGFRHALHEVLELRLQQRVQRLLVVADAARERFQPLSIRRREAAGRDLGLAQLHEQLGAARIQQRQLRPRSSRASFSIPATVAASCE
jgi:hypothetical protein